MKSEKQAAKRALQREARIRVRGLRLRTYIGFNDEEREKKQDVVIDLEIDYRVPAGVFEDQVGDALNYRTITKRVISLVEEGRYLLLEKLVGDVLEVCSDHPDIVRSEVTIQKPHALRFADSVSLTLEYRADRAGHLNLLEKAS